MSAENEQTHAGPVIQMSSADLTAMISAAVSAAVHEAKKPYIDPVVEAAKAMGRAQVHAEEEARMARVHAVQDNCPHEDQQGNHAFCGQRNCLGQNTFLCKMCFRPFIPGDKDYENYIRFVRFDQYGAARS
jgi:hypothetical protein